MRLWHQLLISQLPRQQLIGQHRECCTLRGHGWGRPHTTVNYVFKYSPLRLFYYHLVVMQEMMRSGYSVDLDWCAETHRGIHCIPWTAQELDEKEQFSYGQLKEPWIVYPEHNHEYLWECIRNLKEKGIEIVV